LLAVRIICLRFHASRLNQQQSRAALRTTGVSFGKRPEERLARPKFIIRSEPIRDLRHRRRANVSDDPITCFLSPLSDSRFRKSRAATLLE